MSYEFNKWEHSKKNFEIKSQSEKYNVQCHCFVMTINYKPNKNNINLVPTIKRKADIRCICCHRKNFKVLFFH